MIEDYNKISKIKEDYVEGKTYNEIAKKYEVTYNEVVYLVRKEGWKRESNLSKIKKGNQNALGNKGGPGAEKRNKRALKTGEYETIYDDLLTDEEREFIQNFKLFDEKKELTRQIAMLKMRKERMLLRIKKIQEKNKDMIVKSMAKTNLQTERKNEVETTTEIESSTEAIQRIEEAITRIDESIRRYIDSYHKIDIENKRFKLETSKDKNNQGGLDKLDEVLKQIGGVI